MMETVYNVGVSGRPDAPFFGFRGRRIFQKILILWTKRAGQKQKGENEMRKYKGSGQLETVICNCCGKKLIVDAGIVREGVISVDHTWDFFSEKDGEIHHWDLCETCYDEWISQFQIAPDVEEQVEFI